ncbi:MAG TPA: hypothetical protein VJ749_04610 [Pyrinomonadaceae bacterium]|jgi:hypothetical protein|nr:hypothetical protein [Pyrinomonadaceae bacterium]
MSILTSYRPNFCCECGQKIVRLRWFIWTSRKFCDKCFRKFAKSHWLRPTLSLSALLLFAVLLGRGCRRAPAPLVIERPAPAQKSATINNSATPGGPTAVGQATTSAAPPTITTDDVYICGARTRKGTPCSRRVHGPVRCWQHKGASAMLPQDKLRIKE